ncbi:sulfurtransferase TusA family protein [Thiomicrorhabdus sp.]|uniref:sulfurtransferase TusA family protein n=1 Tax=Thiomicrorhabdus sp. TaxID=2039724 RepID=UPI002AA8BE40|nr:sulfurtransferase TusA family protein [Thiomicrorhabdus sp.]
MQLNLEGLACPMPVIKLKKYLAEHKGETVEINLIISDKAGLRDIPAFCKQAGLSCELIEDVPKIQFNIQSL